jgi:hypothetical protein
MEQRTLEEIQQAIDVLRKALKETPDEDIFGGSNVAEKADMREWADELEDAKDLVEAGEYPERDDASEAATWLHRIPSYINDYLADYS